MAITSVFAPVSARHELAAAEVAREVMGDDIHLSLSHEIGALGILERENSTVLNGALLGVAREVAGHAPRGARRGVASRRPSTSPRTTARSWRSIMPCASPS